MPDCIRCRIGIVGVTALLMVGCALNRDPWSRRKWRLYGPFFRAVREGDVIEFRLPTSEGVEKHFLIGLVGGLAMPAEPVEPVMVSARIPLGEGEQKFLSVIQNRLTISLHDSKGKKFALGPGKIVGGSQIAYKIREWGKIRLNDPDYRLHMEVKLVYKGKTYTSKRSFTCARGTGVKDAPMRADTPTPAKRGKKTRR